jgi:hypothetical protein
VGGVASAAYMVGWGAACLVAAVLVVRKPSSFAFLRAGYWRFLVVPWKVATAAIATTLFVVAAPYTGDPTWDYADALFMSAATFVTAPWAVGALVRALRKRLPRRQAFVAACTWLFSASWSYDAYLFVRDGRYPPTWWANLIVSSFLYVAAGTLWSLGYEPERGVRLAFLAEDWPRRPHPGGTARVIAVGALAMLVAAALMAPFAVEVCRSLLR